MYNARNIVTLTGIWTGVTSAQDLALQAKRNGYTSDTVWVANRRVLILYLPED